jgi:hypothetical protein
VRRPVTVPGWLFLSILLVVAANVVAGTATAVTISLMRGASAFAQTVRANDLRWSRRSGSPAGSRARSCSR